MRAVRRDDRHWRVGRCGMLFVSRASYGLVTCDSTGAVRRHAADGDSRLEIPKRSNRWTKAGSSARLAAPGRLAAGATRSAPSRANARADDGTDPSRAESRRRSHAHARQGDGVRLWLQNQSFPRTPPPDTPERGFCGEKGGECAWRILLPRWPWMGRDHASGCVIGRYTHDRCDAEVVSPGGFGPIARRGAMGRDHRGCR